MRRAAPLLLTVLLVLAISPPSAVASPGYDYVSWLKEEYESVTGVGLAPGLQSGVSLPNSTCWVRMGTSEAAGYFATPYVRQNNRFMRLLHLHPGLIHGLHIDGSEWQYTWAPHYVAVKNGKIDQVAGSADKYVKVGQYVVFKTTTSLMIHVNVTSAGAAASPCTYSMLVLGEMWTGQGNGSCTSQVQISAPDTIRFTFQNVRSNPSNYRYTYLVIKSETAFNSHMVNTSRANIENYVAYNGRFKNSTSTSAGVDSELAYGLQFNHTINDGESFDYVFGVGLSYASLSEAESRASSVLASSFIAELSFQKTYWNSLLNRLPEITRNDKTRLLYTAASNLYMNVHPRNASEGYFTEVVRTDPHSTDHPIYGSEEAYHVYCLKWLDKRLALRQGRNLMLHLNSTFWPHTLDRQPARQAWAFLELYYVSGNSTFLSESYGMLDRILQARLSNQDPDGDGLLQCGSLWANYESGSKYRVEMESVDVNVWWCNDLHSMAEIAGILGNSTGQSYYQALAEDVKTKIQTLMWDAGTEFFYDLWPGNNSRRPGKWASGFYPLFFGLATDSQCTGLLKHLMNSSEFWTDFPVPTLSKDDPNFDPATEWDGGSRVEINALLVRGLVKHYGRRGEALQLLQKTIDMVYRGSTLGDTISSSNLCLFTPAYRSSGTHATVNDNHFSWSAAWMADLLIFASGLDTYESGIYVSGFFEDHVRDLRDVEKGSGALNISWAETAPLKTAISLSNTNTSAIRLAHYEALKTPDRALIRVKEGGRTYFNWTYDLDTGILDIRGLSGTEIDVYVVDPHPIIVQLHLFFTSILAALASIAVKTRRLSTRRRTIALIVAGAALALCIIYAPVLARLTVTGPRAVTTKWR